MSKTMLRLWGWQSKAAKAATRRLAFYDTLAGLTAVGALGFGAYHYRPYQARLQAKIDHQFGAPSPRQLMPPEAEIDEEIDTEERSTAGLVGLLQAHCKTVHDDFEEEFAALNQKIQELKDNQEDGDKERLCEELKRMESKAKTRFLTRYLTWA